MEIILSKEVIDFLETGTIYSFNASENGSKAVRAYKVDDSFYVETNNEGVYYTLSTFGLMGKCIRENLDKFKQVKGINYKDEEDKV